MLGEKALLDSLWMTSAWEEKSVSWQVGLYMRRTWKNGFGVPLGQGKSGLRDDEELCRKGPGRQQVARSQQCTQASEQCLHQGMDQRGVGQPAGPSAVPVWATSASQSPTFRNESS